MSIDLFGGTWEVVGAGKFVDFYSEESEFVDWPGWEGVSRPVGLGAWVMVQAWYKPAAGGWMSGH